MNRGPAIVLTAGVCLAALLTVKGLGCGLAAQLPLKAACSVLFVCLVLVRPKPDRLYFRLVTLGLIFGLAGDVLLEFNGPAPFAAGLIAFLLGHLAYVVALAAVVPLRRWPAWRIAPIWLAALAAGIWLGGYTGPMTIPVVVYITVISVMVTGAAAVAAQTDLPSAFRKLVLLGALLFFLSDLLVAVNAFVVNRYLHSLILLPMYYGGQFMLAASIARREG